MKFVWLIIKYGLDAHRKLAELNMAPQFLYSESLPGKWIVVVMERIVDGMMVDKHDITYIKRYMYNIIYTKNTYTCRVCGDI